MKIVYRAGDIIEAEIVKGMLLSNNIEAHVSGFYLQGGIGEIAPTDLAKVHVTDEDFERAEEIVREYEGTQPEEVTAQNMAEKPAPSLGHQLVITIIVVLAISILSFWVGV